MLPRSFRGLGLLTCLERRAFIVVPFQPGKSPKQGRRQDNRQQEVGRMPEPSAVGQGICHEHLDAVVERDACREQEEEQGLPFGEPDFALHFLAGHIEGQQQHEHRKGEMVGHTDRNHHVGKAEEHRRKQQTVEPWQHDNLAQQAIKKKKAIETAEHEQGCNDERCAVPARDEHQTLIDLIGNEHEKCQQRVAINVVGSVPIRHNFIAQRVESRDMKGVDKHLVIVGCELREAV